MGDSKSHRTSKSHYWFKSYGDFAEWVDFADWWSCIGKGLPLQPAQQACLFDLHLYQPYLLPVASRAVSYWHYQTEA